MALVLACLLGIPTSAQINYSFNFDANSTGWTGNFSWFTGTTSCGGAGGAMRRNLYSGATTGSLISPLTGTANGGLVTIGYTYKVNNWSANTTATAAPWGSFDVQWGTTATGPWTTITTITNEAQLNNACIAKSHSFTPPAGPVYVRWNCTWASGISDAYWNFDNVTLVEALPPCTDPPTVGSIQASSGTPCGPFTLSLTTPIAADGLTYQWERADDAAFTTNLTVLGTGATQVTSLAPSATAYYRVGVQCSGGSLVYSTPELAVTANSTPVAYCGPYCIPPASTFGCTDGDVIARVILNTLDNNSGTGCPSGTLGYSDYTGNPLLTTTLQAGASYGCTVYAGQWAEHYAAWIDYNDDGAFGPTERIGYTTTIVPGSGSVGVLGGNATFPIVLACNPPLGEHRLRVRCMYGQTTGASIDPCTNASAYFETEDYVITISAADPCPAPTSLAAGNPVGNSMDLSWTLGCAETEWDVHIQAAGGGAPGVPSDPGVTSSTFTASGLTAGQIYEFYVRAVCGPSLTSSWSGPITFALPPANGVCTGVSSIQNVGAGGSITISGNSTGAIDADAFGAPHVWEAFTLTECVQSLEFNYCGSTPARTISFVNLFVGCPFTTFIAPTTITNDCANGSRRHVYPALQPGTYYIAITEQTDGSGPYEIEVLPGLACPPPPVNDLCANAIPVDCGVTYTGNTQWGSNTGAPVFGGACGTTDATANGVWYTVSGICGSTTADLCGSNYDTKLFVMTGSCGSFNCVAGNDDASTGPCAFTAQSIVTWDADASTTYYIYVTGFSTNFGDYALTVTCSGTPTAASALVVDDCVGGTFGIDVTISDLGGAATGTITYSVNGGTPVDVTGVGLGTTNINGFATTDAVSVSVGNGTTGCGTALGTFYSNCPIEVVCGNTVVINHCYTNNDGRTFTFSSNTPGETLTVTFIQGSMEAGDVIRGYSGTDNSGDPIDGVPATEGNLTGNFPVLNGVTGTSSSGDLFIEIDSDGSGSCQDGGSTTPWIFEVECTPGCVDPTGTAVVTTDCIAYNFTIDVEVTFTGDGGYTEVEYTVNGGTPQVYPVQLFDFDIANLGPFNIDDNVFIRLLHPGDSQCHHTLGTFTDNGTCPPLGETCAAPINIPSVPYTTDGSNTTFTDDYNSVCPYTATGGKDVVYRYVPPTDQILSLTLCTGVTNYDTKLYVYQDACTGTPISCVDDACTAPLFLSAFVSSITGLSVTAGNTYYIVVDAYSSADQGNYTLVIDELIAPSNDDCSSAEPITVAADQLSCVATPGDNSAASDDGGAFPCIVSGPYSDVWYSFNSGSNTSLSYLISNWNFASLLVEVREGSCAGTSIYCDFGLAGLDGTFATTPNTDYVLRVASEAGGGGTYDLCVYTAPPAYDPCASIANIAACDVPTGPVTNASGDGVFDGNGPYGTPGQEQIFSFTATITGTHTINVTSFTGSWVDFFWKDATACDNTGWNYWDDVIGTGVVPGDNFNGGVALDFTAGNTYYIMWDPESTASRTVDFTVLCPAPPPANDDCANAFVLTVGANGSCPANGTAGNNGGAVQDGPAPTCDFGGPWPDVWYTFNSGSNPTVNVDFTNIGMSDIVIDVFQGGCAGSSVYCGFGGADFALTNLVANTDYVVRVSSNTGFGQGGAHEVCAFTPPPPPANDLCANAIMMDCNSVVSGSTIYATNTGGPATNCSDVAINDPYVNNGAPGVWYTVQGFDGTMTASTCGSNFDTQVWVGTTSDCVTLTCVAGNDDAFGLCSPQSVATWTGSSATTYYVYVTGWTGTGDYTLTVSCGDNNSSCPANGVSLDLENDANAGTETTWEIRAQGSNVLAVSGTGLISNADQTMHACLPDGCYYLRVLDSGGDGLTTGGYVLREQGGNMRRIIDNSGNFNTGSVSAIANDLGFCLPIGDDRLIFASCDKLDWRTSPCNAEYIVANDNPTVTAEYGVSNSASGYQMWWYDPNGGYSFRRLQTHSTTNGLPAGPTRACHFRINAWTGNQLQEGVMYNVRVRSRVNGVFNEFGPACRFMVDNTAASCPATSLMDDPSNTFFICGGSRGLGNNELVHAVPKQRIRPNCTFQNANRYQFRFRIEAENFVLVKTASTNQYFVNTVGLECGKTYDVDVRISFDNGATWCVSTPNPNSVTDPAWGKVCQLTINCGAAQGGNQNMVLESNSGFSMYPNPNRGDQLFLSIDALEDEVRTVSVDIYDAFGKRVSARTVAVNSDNAVNTVLELNGSLATGMYTVTITAGSRVLNERLVIQH
ncbi:MAG: T9SS type A sorting domain-containing protein [Flavobacteriales bacterium]|nr:T9SS type A sorting domain-containing protein [Flavobacteriales bacterium]